MGLKFDEAKAICDALKIGFISKLQKEPGCYWLQAHPDPSDYLKGVIPIADLCMTSVREGVFNVAYQLGLKARESGKWVPKWDGFEPTSVTTKSLQTARSAIKIHLEG